ncbi:hypothetical protein KIPB_007668 [Kipferlia bialata]|uniref:ABC transporter domain-containing protein n=1 Tax=Kipferlia bialata TaxID=797122 RepID=A0A9K3GK78_9EUKA|nr:hypothetical protein KIPB_007668 [Kipferlia bialata]|eukprot:g7668.t1
MSNLTSELDNLDQRFTDIKLAINSVTGSVVPLETGMLLSPAGVISIGVSVLTFTLNMTQFGAPEFLYWPYIVFAVCTFLQWLAMRPVKPITYRQQEKEGSFRYSHSRAREYAESIAFYRGESEESARMGTQFTEVYSNQTRLALYSAVCSFVSGVIYNCTSYILPDVLVKILTPDVDPQQFTVISSDVSMVMSALSLSLYLSLSIDLIYQVDPQQFTVISSDVSMVMSALSLLLGFAMQYSAFSGTLQRVTQMVSGMRALPVKKADHIQSDERLAMRGVDVTAPTGDRLVQNVTFNLEAGEKGLVVMGPSGVGKSSVLRTLAGLWSKSPDGTIVRPGDGEGIFFVPQTSYVLLNGSLRAQIAYPKCEECVTGTPSHVFTDILDTVGLGYLVSDGRYSLDEPNIPWGDMLSGGEKQRLGFARLFFNCPRFAILDESTSALPVDLETALHRECRRRGISLVSVAHRPSVIPHHCAILKVDKKGWELTREVE